MLLRGGRLPLSSFLCFVGGFSMGSWLTLFHQLQAERESLEFPISVGGVHEGSFLLIVLILSAPGRSPERRIARDTWLKSSPGRPLARHFFSIGTAGLSERARRQLEEEDELEGDLLFLPSLFDSYGNLSRKVLESLAVLSDTAPYKFLMKVDDDSFARIDKIAEELQERRDFRTCFYWGFFDGRAKIRKGGKWGEGEYGLCDRYVPYALGGGYVLSKPCTEFLVHNRDHLRLFANEDVAVGTWLAPLQVTRKHDVRFDTEWESRGCVETFLVQHGLSGSEAQDRWESLTSRGKLCRTEALRRQAYEYDWNALPSNCCKRFEMFEPGNYRRRKRMKSRGYRSAPYTKPYYTEHLTAFLPRRSIVPSYGGSSGWGGFGGDVVDRTPGPNEFDCCEGRGRSWTGAGQLLPTFGPPQPSYYPPYSYWPPPDKL